MRQSARKILVIDDEPDVARVFVLILTRAGFKVQSATDGKTGCQLAETEGPSLIFCDERMPGFDGYATLKQLKENPATADIPVVMMGGTHEHGIRDWRSEGAVSFVPKPFPVTQVLALARKLVREESTPAL